MSRSVPSTRLQPPLVRRPRIWSPDPPDNARSLPIPTATSRIRRPRCSIKSSNRPESPRRTSPRGPIHRSVASPLRFREGFQAPPVPSGPTPIGISHASTWEHRSRRTSFSAPKPLANGKVKSDDFTLPIGSDNLFAVYDGDTIYVRAPPGHRPSRPGQAWALQRHYDDWFYGSPGSSNIQGSSGNDFFWVPERLVPVNGSNGNNCFWGGDGDNDYSGGNGRDEVTSGNGNNEISLGNGNDERPSGRRNECHDLGGGNDTVSVGNGNHNRIVVGNGNDALTVGNGSANQIYSAPASMSSRSPELRTQSPVVRATTPCISVAATVTRSSGQPTTPTSATYPPPLLLARFTRRLLPRHLDELHGGEPMSSRTTRQNGRFGRRCRHVPGHPRGAAFSFALGNAAWSYFGLGNPGVGLAKRGDASIPRTNVTATFPNPGSAHRRRRVERPDEPSGITLGWLLRHPVPRIHAELRPAERRRAS